MPVYVCCRTEAQGGVAERISSAAGSSPQAVLGNGGDYFMLFLSQLNLISGLPGGVNSLLSMHSTRALQTDGQTEKQSQ